MLEPGDQGGARPEGGREAPASGRLGWAGAGAARGCPPGGTSDRRVGWVKPTCAGGCLREAWWVGTHPTARWCRRGSGEGLVRPGANRFAMSWPAFCGGNTFENARNSKMVPIIILLVESKFIYSSIWV